MSEAPHLLIEAQGATLVCTLNRPDKLNALTGQTMALLEDALHKFRDTEALKVMLIRATGRYFCSGADLRDNSDGAPQIDRTGVAIREKHRLKLHGMHRIYDEMEHIEKPIVVAHQGTCVGGGLELSLSCDFRLAAKSASYSFPEGKFGVLPASNGVSRLTRYVGPHWARYLIMANKPADAERALLMGLVHEVYSDETFDADVMAFCEHLAGNNGEQMGMAKLAIELCHELGRDQARHIERLGNSTLMLNPDYLAGIEKYISMIGSKGKSKGE
ncbi:enoyl-CoA hydratase/isomerase family protein [Halioxenophilus sp. WMMB6]|uniref:enoyl-CoA hydratase/isomerase family protein n=1 Tax=Halioxenophilus sp. WMMB6 TaxID=3073815 RepID=UPI00295EA8D2|nr:enoyl-CoA hydratase/isomerase family protein [Halioxenophilus sp. WMMB6]